MSPLVKPVSLLSRPAPLTGSLSFDGNNDGLRILDGAQTGLDLSGDLTLETWIKWDSLPATSPADASYDFLISKSGDWGGSNNRSYFLTLNNSGGDLRLWMHVSDDGLNGDAVLWTGLSLSTGVWYHIAVTVDISEPVASEMELFINTVSQGNGTVFQNDNAASIYNGINPFVLGYQDADDSPATKLKFFNGHLADVRVWNDIRTPTEISANYQNVLYGNEPNLVSWWRLDDGSGTTAADSGPNGNTLSFVDVPTWTTDVPY